MARGKFKLKDLNINLFRDMEEATLARWEAIARIYLFAELIQLNQQHLLVNQLMALIAGQYLYKLLMREPIYSNYTVVDTDYLVMRSEMITREHLVNVVKQIA